MFQVQMKQIKITLISPNVDPVVIEIGYGYTVQDLIDQSGLQISEIRNIHGKVLPRTMPLRGSSTYYFS
jgi:hypothetical protein